MGSYEEECKIMLNEGKINYQEFAKMMEKDTPVPSNPTPVKPPAEGGNLDNLREQTSFDLVNVDTLEAQISSMNREIEDYKKLIDNYKGHYNKDKQLIKEYKKLLISTVMHLEKVPKVDRNELYYNLTMKLLERNLVQRGQM